MKIQCLEQDWFGEGHMVAGVTFGHSQVPPEMQCD